MFNFSASNIIVLLSAVSLFAWIYFGMTTKFPILSIFVMISAVLAFVVATKNDANNL